ncbi:response regulator transcription factor [Cohnella fermenti]|uniref:Response regulator n=1 Tax=Cohnella fermenti TaxID=2565925 RepID=A0A4S4C639_9BACL|nr:response regulator [Cohnella fermenti]THF83320.1 response regulator [Cohnella fermenti]
MYRVIIADDEASIRQGIRKILQRFAPQWELVGDAEDGDAAMREIVRLQPDLVILDYRMPGLTGIECCERIAAEAPHIHRILLTAYQEFQLAKQAIGCGVAAFITKPLDRGELLQTLDKVAQTIDQERSERARLDALQQSLRAAPLAEKLYYRHFRSGQDDREPAEQSELSLEQLLHGNGEEADAIGQQRSAPDAPLLQRVQQFVSESLADGVSLQSVADRFGMNASYFSRRFKYETGRNFVVFLKECRMERAKKLIEQSEHSLQEISELIGYADLKHFYRVFKEHTSYSPSEYKKRHS